MSKRYAVVCNGANNAKMLEFDSFEGALSAIEVGKAGSEVYDAMDFMNGSDWKYLSQADGNGDSWQWAYDGAPAVDISRRLNATDRPFVDAEVADWVGHGDDAHGARIGIEEAVMEGLLDYRNYGEDGEAWLEALARLVEETVHDLEPSI